MECDISSSQPAVYFPISQILDEKHSNLGKMVRVIGKQTFYNSSTSRLLVQDSEVSSLLLDVSRIEPFFCQRGCLCLFIGELGIECVNEEDSIILQVIVCRCVKELNLDVYCKAYSHRMASIKMWFYN